MVLCTTEKTAIGETPFMLAYGFEAVLLVEVALYTHRLRTFQEELNNAALRAALDPYRPFVATPFFGKPSISSALYVFITV